MSARTALITGTLAMGLLACSSSHSAEPGSDASAPTTPAAPSSASTAAPADTSAAPADRGPLSRCAPAGERKPLAVRWSRDETEALRTRMDRGLAIVAWDCDGLRLLPACSAPGRYRYLGSLPGVRAVGLASPDELQVNAPLTGRGPAAEPGAATSMHLAIATVGQRATARQLLTPADLRGDCTGATGFIHAADIGATAILPGAKGPAPAPKALFDNPAASKNGSLEACLGARPGTAAPPESCAAHHRLHITPIRSPEGWVPFTQAEITEPMQIGVCPAGMVISGHRCTKTPGSAPYLCMFGDAAQCTTQCGRSPFCERCAT